MFWNMFGHEWKMLFKTKKNLLFLLLLGIFLLGYCLFLLPGKETSDSFDPEVTKQELDEIAAKQKTREKEGNTGFGFFVGYSPYAVDKHYYQIHKKMIHAFESHDMRRFLLLRMYYMAQNEESFVHDTRLFADSPFPVKDRMHLYNQRLLNYQEYLNKDYPITYPLIEQKTSWQAMKNILLDGAAFFIIFCGIYFSCDVLIRDRNFQSVVQGMPFAWYRLINVKSLAVFLFTITVLISFFIIGFLLNGMHYGFGYLDLHIPIKIKEQQFTLDDYGTMATWLFFLQSCVLGILIIYLFIRVNMVLSLVVKNTWFVLMVSSVLLFIEKIYFSSRTRELFGFDISNFPQTYFDFAKVITGEKNYLVNVETIDFQKGLVVLLLMLVVVEIALYLSSRLVHRRRFFQMK